MTASTPEFWAFGAAEWMAVTSTFSTGKLAEGPDMKTLLGTIKMEGGP